MVNLKLVLLTFLFTTTILFTSCYKDNVNFEPYETTLEQNDGNIDRFFSQIPDFSDSMNFVVSDGQIVVTENSTVIEILANSFLNEDGTLAVGEITFKYFEILNPANYLFLGLPTISDGKLLSTEGVYRFEVTKNGKKLKLKDGKSIKVHLPNENPISEMGLFEAIGQGDSFNWNDITDDPIGGFGIQVGEWGFQIDSLQQWVGDYGYIFNCDLFQWINVDIFVDVPEEDKTSVCVDLPDLYTDKNTVVFMLFDEVESILGLRPDADLMQFCEPYGASPIGYNVTFIAIANIDDGVFHFGIQEAKITKDHVEMITPEEKSIEDIIKIIEDL